MNKETRYMEFEIRAEKTEERGSVITGQPIVFNQETDLGLCRETIDIGALDSTDLRDVRFLVGHDFSMVPLARSRNNNENSTMQLTVNETGMGIRVNLDTENNPRAAELYSAIRRGDISGMSFAFTVDKDSWEGLDTESPLRHIRSIDRVFEVSAVAFSGGFRRRCAGERQSLAGERKGAAGRGTCTGSRSGTPDGGPGAAGKSDKGGKA